MRSCARFAVYATAVAAMALIATGNSAAITPAGLERKARAAMESGAYEEAAEILTTLLDRVPDAPGPLYNLACCASRLEDIDRAAEALQEAWDAGFRDLELIRSDPDLLNLRTTGRGKRMIGRFEKALQRERRLRGEALVFDAAVLGSARVVTPEPMRSDRRYPLVVALHGNGGSSERFAGIFVAAGLSPDIIVVAPQGPYATTTINGSGYSWYPPLELFKEVTAQDAVADREELLSRQIDMEQRERETGARYVLAAVDAASREYPVDQDEVYVLGFSQGGVLAYELALNHPDRFQGIIAVGTFLGEHIATPATLAGAKGKIRALVCHSPEDEAVSVDQGKAAARRLRESGIDSRFVRYDGGHSLSAELLAQIVKWINGAPVDRIPPQRPAP